MMRSFFRCSVSATSSSRKALRSISGLGEFTVIRRASSCVSRFGRGAVRRSNTSGLGEKRKRRGCRR